MPVVNTVAVGGPMIGIAITLLLAAPAVSQNCPSGQEYCGGRGSDQCYFPSQQECCQWGQAAALCSPNVTCCGSGYTVFSTAFCCQSATATCCNGGCCDGATPVCCPNACCAADQLCGGDGNCVDQPQPTPVAWRLPIGAMNQWTAASSAPPIAVGDRLAAVAMPNTTAYVVYDIDTKLTVCEFPPWFASQVYSVLFDNSTSSLLISWSSSSQNAANGTVAAYRVESCNSDMECPCRLQWTFPYVASNFGPTLERPCGSHALAVVSGTYVLNATDGAAVLVAFQSSRNYGASVVCSHGVLAWQASQNVLQAAAVDALNDALWTAPLNASFSSVFGLAALDGLVLVYGAAASADAVGSLSFLGSTGELFARCDSLNVTGVRNASLGWQAQWVAPPTAVIFNTLYNGLGVTTAIFADVTACADQATVNPSNWIPSCEGEPAQLPGTTLCGQFAVQISWLGWNSDGMCAQFWNSVTVFLNTSTWSSTFGGFSGTFQELWIRNGTCLVAGSSTVQGGNDSWNQWSLLNVPFGQAVTAQPVTSIDNAQLSAPIYHAGTLIAVEYTATSANLVAFNMTF